MAISKPAQGSTGWDNNVNQVIDQVNGMPAQLDLKPTSNDIDNIVVLTQSAYDGLGSYNNRTLYVIV